MRRLLELHLAKIGELTGTKGRSREYIIGVKVEGPYKPEYYRY